MILPAESGLAEQPDFKGHFAFKPSLPAHRIVLGGLSCSLFAMRRLASIISAFGGASEPVLAPPAQRLLGSPLRPFAKLRSSKKGERSYGKHADCRGQRADNRRAQGRPNLLLVPLWSKPNATHVRRFPRRHRPGAARIQASVGQEISPVRMQANQDASVLRRIAPGFVSRSASAGAASHTGSAMCTPSASRGSQFCSSLAERVSSRKCKKRPFYLSF